MKINYNKSTFFKSISILIPFLLFGILLGCSVDVEGPDYHLDTRGLGNFNYEYSAEKTIIDEIPVLNPIKIKIQAANGEIRVEGRNDGDRILVTARLIVSSNNQADADLHLDDLDISLTEDEHEILIRTIQPERSNGRGYRVEYDLIVPADIEVVALQDNGSILIHDIQDNVDISNENGDIQVSNITGGVQANVVNGSIEGDISLPLNGVIELETVNGSIELSIPTTTSAYFSASVDSFGSVSIHNLVFTDPISTSQSFTGLLGNGAGSILLGTDIGNIEIFGFMNDNQ